MSDHTERSRPRRRRVVALSAAGLAAAALVAGLLVALGGGSSGPGDFSWFRASPPPSGWHQVTLPDGARLFYPPSLRPTTADPGAASVVRRGADDVYVGYLNATPWTLPPPDEGWARARIDRLSDEDTAIVEDGARDAVEFAGGGRGSCVADHYVTRIGHHRFFEMACLVRSPTGTSVVLVAAASAAQWPGRQSELRQALEAFRA